MTASLELATAPTVQSWLYHRVSHPDQPEIVLPRLPPTVPWCHPQPLRHTL